MFQAAHLFLRRVVLLAAIGVTAVGMSALDERAALFFFGCAPPKKLGAATLYLLGSKDAAGAPLVNSYQQMQKSSDGAVDVFFGSAAPAGKEANWIYTAPGKQWVSIFRFYGPEPAVHDKSWTLPDIQAMR